MGDKKKDIKKIKNILSDKVTNSKDFDVLYVVDATASMSPYIIAAKEETKNISAELRKTYPDMMFKYGYVFYRDPIDSKSDIHEFIDLTDDVNSLPEKIGKIQAKGGGDLPEDWVGAYKIVNEKISWRNGNKAIIHLADAGAHGKLFTLNDKYPEEEEKLIKEIEKCALKDINIFGYIIEDDARNSFNELSKIYRSKGGSFEISDFLLPNQFNNMMNAPFSMNNMMMNSNMNMMNAPPYNMNNMMMNNNMMNAPLSMNNMMMNNNMNMMNAPPYSMNNMMMNSNMNMNQSMINSNFNIQSLNSIKNVMIKNSK